MKVLTVVAAALIRENGHMLLAQRPPGKAMAGLWELPGGKLETGESPETALVRELKEELGIVVNEKNLEPFTFASHRYEDFHLLMPIFICRHWLGQLQPVEGQALAWASAQDIMDFPAPEADIPLFERYIEWTREQDETGGSSDQKVR